MNKPKRFRCEGCMAQFATKQTLHRHIVLKKDGCCESVRFIRMVLNTISEDTEFARFLLE